ncbi:MAG TPA: rhomboid family intramembrane serine protease [Armatimonadaceae bacterium]|nr:rhomboid family intramembrane serine protease [Armatimonadaceae bacterium]
MIPLRDENPTRTTPVLTWTLILVNVLVYIAQAMGGMSETRTGLSGAMAGWTMVPREVTQGVDLAINGPTLRPIWLTLFTSMFMHGGLLHLGGNMLYLMIFGNNIEDSLGKVRFLLFYLLCGVLAAGAQIAIGPGSAVPTLGASGAIAGVLGGYLILYPRARVDSLVILGFLITRASIPAFFLLGFWLVSQFFGQFLGFMKGGSGGGVAYMAHIGGFVAGMLLIRLFGPRTHDDAPPRSHEVPVYRAYRY